MLWGNTDNAANSTIFAAAQVSKTPNTANQTTLFNNVTEDAIVPDVKVGQFGVSAAEMVVGSGVVASINLVDPGYGYFGNTTVTVTGGGGASATANAQANATSGFIQQVNVTAGGSSYESAPTVAIAAPSINFNGNTAVSEVTDFITIAGNGVRLANDMLVTYTVDSGNTAVGGLTAGEQYYVVGANSTGIQLSLEVGGDPIALTKTVTETGHNIVGKTATAVAVVGGATNQGVAHAGWVLRTEGTGGRAGRVQYETLVAMRSIGGDASDDTILPDA